jgi:hypothetical protein
LFIWLLAPIDFQASDLVLDRRTVSTADAIHAKSILAARASGTIRDNPAMKRATHVAIK